MLDERKVSPDSYTGSRVLYKHEFGGSWNLYPSCELKRVPDQLFYKNVNANRKKSQRVALIYTTQARFPSLVLRKPNQAWPRRGQFTTNSQTGGVSSGQVCHNVTHRWASLGASLPQTHPQTSPCHGLVCRQTNP